MGSVESCSWVDAIGEKKKKRFSEDQVRSLETMFRSQSKLDPRKKQQVAGELGLEPRQVAIWFQNKRARWKTKQLESEYNALRADYEDLLSSYEAIKKENQILTKQVEMLSEGRREDCDSIGPCKQELDVREMLRTFSDEEAKLHMEHTASNYSFQPSWPLDQSCSSSHWWEFWTVKE